LVRREVTLISRQPRSGSQGQEQVRAAVPLVMLVDPFRFARLDRQGRADLCAQLLRRLVETDHRIVRVIWTAVHIQHIFHAAHELGILARWDHPAQAAPGLQLFFLSTLRTV
jgi:hypothetical protein